MGFFDHVFDDNKTAPGAGRVSKSILKNVIKKSPVKTNVEQNVDKRKLRTGAALGAMIGTESLRPTATPREQSRSIFKRMSEEKVKIPAKVDVKSEIRNLAKTVSKVNPGSSLFLEAGKVAAKKATPLIEDYLRREGNRIAELQKEHGEVAGTLIAMKESGEEVLKSLGRTGADLAALPAELGRPTRFIFPESEKETQFREKLVGDIRGFANRNLAKDPDAPFSTPVNFISDWLIPLVALEGKIAKALPSAFRTARPKTAAMIVDAIADIGLTSVTFPSRGDGTMGGFMRELMFSVGGSGLAGLLAKGVFKADELVDQVKRTDWDALTPLELKEQTKAIMTQAHEMGVDASRVVKAAKADIADDILEAGGVITERRSAKLGGGEFDESLQPLIAEARKFDTVEEFVGSFERRFHQTSTEARKGIEKEGFILSKRKAGKNDILPIGVNTKATDKKITLPSSEEQLDVYFKKGLKIKEFETRIDAERFFYDHIDGKAFREATKDFSVIDNKYSKKLDEVEVKMDKRYKEIFGKKSVSDDTQYQSFVEESKKVLEEWGKLYNAKAKIAQDTATKITKKEGIDVISIKQDEGGFGKTTDNTIVIDPKAIKTKAQLTDIWKKAHRFKSGGFVRPFADVKPSKQLQIGEEAGELKLPEIKTSKLGKGIEEKAVEKKLADSFGELPEYEVVNLKKQAAAAKKIIAKDYDQAKRIAMGEAEPIEGVLSESVLVAIEKEALERGDVETLRQLATSSKLVDEATVMGQRIRTLGERNPDSPVHNIQRAAKNRLDGFERRTRKSVKRAKKETVAEIKAHVKKGVATKKDWISFIDNIKC